MLNKMFKLLIKYVTIAIFPVVIGWLLGYFKLPDEMVYLDYSVTSSELLQIDSHLRKEVSIQVDEKEVPELYLYSLHFINESNQHLGKTKISLVVESGGKSELISTSLKGPKGYSPNFIHKIDSLDKNTIVYELELINIAGNQSPDYFTANFLFAGALPNAVIPASHTKGTEFRPFEQAKNEWIAGTLFATFFAVYIAFLWWLNKRFDAKLEAKKDIFKLNVRKLFTETYKFDDQQSEAISIAVEEQRKQAFHPPGWLKRKLREIAND